MASSVVNTWAWPSCTVQHGVTTIVSRKIVRCVVSKFKTFVCCIYKICACVCNDASCSRSEFKFNNILIFKPTYQPYCFDFYARETTNQVEVLYIPLEV